MLRKAQGHQAPMIVVYIGKALKMYLCLYVQINVLF